MKGKRRNWRPSAIRYLPRRISAPVEVVAVYLAIHSHKNLRIVGAGNLPSSEGRSPAPPQNAGIAAKWLPLPGRSCKKPNSLDQNELQVPGGSSIGQHLSSIETYGVYLQNSVSARWTRVPPGAEVPTRDPIGTVAITLQNQFRSDQLGASAIGATPDE